VEVVDTKCPIDPAFSLHDRVVIHLKNGDLMDSGDIRFCRGNAFLPLDAEALKQKFIDCLAHGHETNEVFVSDLYAKLTDLENMKSIRPLFSSSK
jgi:hypothetical protein